MIRVKVNESFPITVTLLDEQTGEAATGRVVSYDIRSQPGDVQLSPVISGTLSESTVEPGIYSVVLTIPETGNYIIYATSDDFLSNTEEVIVDEYDNSSLLAALYANRHYNVSFEDVIRTENTPTASQAARNVPKGRTDYVITKIKRDEDTDWSDPVAQGNVYAWYRSSNDKAPYLMGGSE